MVIILLIIIIFSYFMFIAPVALATCTLFEVGPDRAARVVGQADFVEKYPFGPSEIKIRARGPWSDGPHGLHIHESGSMADGCASACAHYNPFGARHGGPDDGPFSRHLGDLGNILVSGGEIDATISGPGVFLRGPFSVIGRSLVLHEGPDDLGKGNWPDSGTTGHSGARIACGPIVWGPGPKKC